MDNNEFALGASMDWDEDLARKKLDWLGLILLFALFSNGKKDISEISEMAEKIKNGEDSTCALMLNDIERRFGENK